MLPGAEVTKINQSLEKPAFEQVRTRIEKCQRIADDLKLPPEQEVHKQREEEIRKIEKQAKPEQEVKGNELKEVKIDTAGFQEQRVKLTYTDPSGAQITEEVVAFVKPDPKGGTPQWLTVNGQPIAINASVYDTKLSSQRDPSAAIIPIIDGRASYTGVLQLTDSSKPPLEVKPAAQVESPEPVIKTIDAADVGTHPEKARGVLEQMANPQTASEIGIDFGSDIDHFTTIVGGQIIDTSPRYPGETREQATQKAWLRAWRNAQSVDFISLSERQQNASAIQEAAKQQGIDIPTLNSQESLSLIADSVATTTIVDAEGQTIALTNEQRGASINFAIQSALNNGVSRENVAAKLQELGIKVTLIDAQKVASATRSPEQQPAAEVTRDHEHILYAEKVRIVPDTHGLSPDFYGVDENSTNVVSVGDIIDAPKNLPKPTTPYFDDIPNRSKWITDNIAKGRASGWKQFLVNSEAEYLASIERTRQEWNQKIDAGRNVNIRKNAEVWTKLLESGNGTLVLGNHELMAMSGIVGNDHDLAQWLCEDNKGKTTLAAFGIDVSGINVQAKPQLDKKGKPLLDEKGNPIETLELPPEQCSQIREQINNNTELKKFFDQLFTKGKMYAVANEMLVVHAGIPLAPDGSLTPPQRYGANWTGFDGLVGLDALDKIEEGIRNRDPDILHWLGCGSSHEMTPSWVREPFFAVMENSEASRKAMDQLSAQAAARGGNVKGIMIGHTEDDKVTRRRIGGTMIGTHVLGTDTAVGDVVELDTSNKKDVQIKARHNFGQKGTIGYNMKNSL